MPIDHLLTEPEDPRYRHLFPWEMDISNEQFMLWSMGKLQYRTMMGDMHC